MATADDEGLVFTGVARQAQVVHDRQFSPHELVALYLERIAQLDPVLNTFRVVLAEQAMTEAAQVERRLAAGEVLPLAGVPAELLRSLGHEVVEPVLAKPPIRVGHLESLGPTRAMAGILAGMPFTPPQNFTGQPAMSVPAGVSADGLPEAVHLVGRPHDASTLVSLAAQLESARPWAPPPSALYRTPASG